MDGDEVSNISLTLALQLTTLASIATGLVLYLVCSGRNGRAGHRKICGPYYYEGDPAGASECGSGLAVLVTACDGALGLQIAKHLHALGFRVFAGFKDPATSIGAKLLVAATTPTPPNDEESSVPVPIHPPVCPIALDVTREDMLHEAVDLVRQRLPASQQGLWSVVNTAGLCCRGRLEAQDGSVWDAMLRQNVVGSLRAARALLPLLRNKKGRLINLGAPCAVDKEAGSGGLVAYTAVRYAVEGACHALRSEVAPLGVHVITLQPEPSAFPERLFASPRFPNTTVEMEDDDEAPATDEAIRHLQAAEVLPALALRHLEEALLASAPRETYSLASSPAGLAGMWMGAVTSISGFLYREKNTNSSEKNVNPPEGRTKQPC